MVQTQLFTYLHSPLYDVKCLGQLVQSSDSLLSPKFTINECFNQSSFDQINCQAVSDINDKNAFIYTFHVKAELGLYLFRGSIILAFSYVLVFSFLLFSGNFKVENKISTPNDKLA